VSRSAAIAAYCRECVYDPVVGGTWREQVAVCACTDCPLWCYRPLPRNPPAGVQARDPASLPSWFGAGGHDQAIAALRSDGCAKPDSASVFHARLTAQVGGATTPPGEGGSA
jgi:hypothetical protein